MHYSIVVIFNFGQHPGQEVGNAKIFTSPKEAAKFQKEIADKMPHSVSTVCYKINTEDRDMTEEEVLNHFVEHLDDGGCDFKWKVGVTLRGTNKEAEENRRRLDETVRFLQSLEKTTDGNLQVILNEALTQMGSPLRVQ